MHPEDRVLVGVMNRLKDFKIAREQGWYRIPEGKAPKGLQAEYIAFFFSRAFKEQNGGIHFYAKRTGLELAIRAQLIPDEPNHKRAGDRYHVLQFGPLKAKVPPIENQSKRRLSFIYTTWDRFVNAASIDDLYSDDDHLVDRVFYTLKDAGYRPKRRWQLENNYPVEGAQLRILCEDGEVVASTVPGQGIHIESDLNRTVERIKQQIAEKGGPIMLSVPIE